MMNKQNKRKRLYIQAHVNKQALKSANDTRDQALSYADGWNTNHNRL